MSRDEIPSAGRFTRWAVMLVLPLVLGAAFMPWILKRLRAAPAQLPATLSGAPANAGGEPNKTEPPEPPRRPEAATPAEREAARAAAAEAARLEQRHLTASSPITPRAAVTTAEGERVTPFQGFGLSIDTTPSGARVLVGGKEVGETPLVAGVDCAPGAEVALAIELRGYRTVRRTVRCRVDALLELAIALRR
jgi:hypothetical protein